MASAAFVCVLVFLQLLLASSGANMKAQARLKNLMGSNDASTDVFTLLNDKQRMSWRGDATLNISTLRVGFGAVPVTVTVDVKLVGFGGEGGPRGAVRVTDTELLRHLQGLRRELESVVLQPELRQQIIKPTIEFRVSHADSSLLDKVNQGIATGAAAERARPNVYLHDGLRLNYRSVDTVIAEDMRRSQQATEGVALTVYVLNPQPPLDAHGDHMQYLYSYEEPGENKPDLGVSCPGTFFASSSFPAYLWVDIRAGPHLYGPLLGRRGQVFPRTWPNPAHYGEAHMEKSVVPDLAAMVWSAAQHMAWPPVLHTDITPKESVLVHMVHMHDTLGPPADRLDQDYVVKLLGQALQGVQKVEVAELWLPFAHCELCVVAYASALKLRTARSDGSTHLQAHVTKVLDRLALHEVLQQHKEAIMTGFPGWGDSHVDFGPTDTRHVIPVFVLDISDAGQRGMLLDGVSKATAFSDMVIAVSSKAEVAPAPFQCRWHHVEPPAGNVTREVLAALLSAGWGVADPATYYSVGAGEGEDYRWSLGNTPFGPLSHRLTIGAAQAQTARRNVVVAHLEHGAARVTRLLDAFTAISESGRLDARTVGNKRDLILQRLNVAQFKLNEAAKMLAQWRADTAMMLIKSMQHDIVALEKAARDVSSKLHGRMQCEGATNVWSVLWAPSGALLMWPLALWIRARRHGASNKADKAY